MTYAKTSEMVSNCCGAEIDYEAGVKVCSECGKQCRTISEDEWDDIDDDKEEE